MSKHAIWLVATLMALAACSRPPASEANDPVLVGAGDIARCDDDQDEATAALIEDIDGTVFTLGDNVYDDATPEQFAECYDASWGRFKDRTYPVIGNHEYWTEDAEGYFGYFGEAAGEHGKGWYSYDLGTWHIIVLNSECEFLLDGCDEASEQGQWLKADLEAHPGQCSLAMWHRPRFSLGGGFDDRTTYFWDLLYEHNADVILNGHDHHYVRFAPQTPNGEEDTARGIRQFIIGTGGAELYAFEAGAANVEVRNRSTFGVFKMTLHDASYSWEFIPTGGLFRDQGRGGCH